MNINRVTAASAAILAAQKQGKFVPAAIAMALESSGLLRLPETEGYPGELAAIRTAVQHGGTPTVADIVAEHYADERAAYAAAEPVEKDTAAAATSTPLTVYGMAYEHSLLPGPLYASSDVARARCEKAVSLTYPATVALLFDWLGDDEDASEPRELVVSIDDHELPTSYTVLAIPVDTSSAQEAER